MKIKAIFLICIFLLPLVIADNSFIYKKNTEVDLKISCFDENNTLCNSNTNCMININKPNGDNLVQNRTMTFNSDYFNYTLGASNLSLLGKYYVVVRCQGTTNGFSTFTFKVTPSGEDLTTANSVSYLLLLLGVFIIFGITVAAAVKIKFGNHRDEEGKIISISDFKFLKIVLIYVAFLEFLFIVSIMNDIAQSYLFLAGLGKMLNAIYIALLIMASVAGLLLVPVVIILFIQDKKTQELLERGVSLE